MSRPNGPEVSSRAWPSCAAGPANSRRSTISSQLAQPYEFKPELTPSGTLATRSPSGREATPPSGTLGGWCRSALSPHAASPPVPSGLRPAPLAFGFLAGLGGGFPRLGFLLRFQILHGVGQFLVGKRTSRLHMHDAAILAISGDERGMRLFERGAQAVHPAQLHVRILKQLGQ